MERMLTNFVRALRSADVPVSPVESIEAAKALELIGYGDRDLLKRSLACVLAKSEVEKDTHDRMFDLFFSRPDSALTPAPETDETETDEQDQDTSENAQQLSQQQAGGSPGQGGAPMGGGSGQSQPDLLELYQSGDPAQIAMELERAANAAGVDDIRFSTQSAFFARRMLEEMGVKELEARLLEQLQQSSSEADDAAQDMMDARSNMLQRARDYVDQRFDLFGAGQTEAFMDDFVSDKSIGQLDGRDMERMKALTAKVAKKLAVKHARRRKRKNRGQLDVRKTLRMNAGLDATPFHLEWKQKKKDKPKIVAICDVSGSVAQYVRFLLMLLYALKDVAPDIETFAFSNRLKPVGDYLDQMEFDAAMARIMKVAGMGSTDYGQALSDLKVNHWNTIDRRTTVIILGDGRNNNGDPRLDIIGEVSARAKRLIWLCPEHPASWGSGDSEMLRYKPYCSAMRHTATLKALERAIDDALAAYD